MTNINAAISSFQKGDLDSAEFLCFEILNTDSRSHGAYFILALISKQRGFDVEAEKYYLSAIDIAPQSANYRIALSAHFLERDNPGSALPHLEHAISLDPLSFAAHTNIGTAYKKIGDLKSAVIHFEKSCKIRRSSKNVDSNMRENPDLTFHQSRIAKIEHDIEQFDFLNRVYPDKKNFRSYAEILRNILPDFSKRTDSHGSAVFTESEYNNISHFYNRLMWRYSDDKVSPILGDHQVNRGILGSFNNDTDEVLIIDNFLSERALASIRNYCLESTVWFDSKNDSAYLGAYMHDGFIPSITLGIGDELSKKWPQFFSDLTLTQLWAFKYDQEGHGTGLHADDASININLWITPDECCLDPENSGLTLYPVSIPEDAEFSEYNNDQNGLRELVSKEEENRLKIPYRCNRALIFRSRIIHQTSPYRFRAGYQNRRVNITLLFEKMV